MIATALRFGSVNKLGLGSAVALAALLTVFFGVDREVFAERVKTMLPIQQIIRAQTSEGKPVYLLCPMTSRELPARVILDTARRFSSLDTLAKELQTLDSGTRIYFAEPEWFKAPNEFLSALTRKEALTLKQKTGTSKGLLFDLPPALADEPVQ